MSLAPHGSAAASLHGAAGLSPSAGIRNTDALGFAAAPHSVRASAAVGDRRKSADRAPAPERRQFGSSHAGLSPEAKELAVAVDEYKIAFRRRYLTSEELLAVIHQLGYRRVDRVRKRV